MIILYVAINMGTRRDRGPPPPPSCPVGRAAGFYVLLLLLSAFAESVGFYRRGGRSFVDSSGTFFLNKSKTKLKHVENEETTVPRVFVFFMSFCLYSLQYPVFGSTSTLLRPAL